METELESVALVGGGEESSGVTSREVGFADPKCHTKSCLELISGVFGNKRRRQAEGRCHLPKSGAFCPVEKENKDVFTEYTFIPLDNSLLNYQLCLLFCLKFFIL